jgi:hypothetical protein
LKSSILNHVLNFFKLSSALLFFLILNSCGPPSVEKSNLDFFPFTELINIITSNRKSLQFSYPNSTYTLTLNNKISLIEPNTNSQIFNCESTPTLPNGLILGKDCSISGTPTISQSPINYLIRGKNASSISSTSLILSITNSIPIINYSGSPFVFTNGVSTTVSPSIVGTVTACSTFPSLPVGLSIDSSCTISGTPTSDQVSTSYTVNADNSFGTGSTTILITIQSLPPSSLTYSPTSKTFTQNIAISTFLPTFSGSISSCTSSPTLPTGLTINNSNCSITGTPTLSQISTNYTITATNAYGSTTANISIAINIEPPSSLTYASASYTFTINSAISDLIPTYSGSITSCSTSPTLPSGLGIDSLSCKITGTPVSISSATVYTITASNSSGSTQTTLSLTINPEPPSSLSYALSPFTLTENIASPNLTPTYSGSITSCSSSPTLPVGLGINNTNCVISGTPTLSQIATNYTITASNAYGSTTTSITITINIAAPSSLVYSGSPFTFTQNSMITTVTPTFNGTVTSCSSSPTLPLGLNISNTTCAISGTPTNSQISAAYTITASNSTGSTTANISILINLEPPNSLVYSGTPFTFTQNAMITTVTPTYNGTVTSCSASPTLPSGLNINTTTCAISGTPTDIQSSTSYTITATNSTGSTTANISIAINIAPPSNLVYSNTNLSLYKSLAMTAQIPTYDGTITSCTAAPTLPIGLSINSTTCSLAGTPSNTQNSTSYTITASNSSGSTTATLSITIIPSGKVYVSTFLASSAYAEKISSAFTNTGTNTPVSLIGRSYSVAFDRTRDILYVARSASSVPAAQNSILVYDNASSNATTHNREIIITDMLLLGGIDIDPVNDELYAANLNSTTANTSRFIYRIFNASTQNGTLTLGTHYFKFLAPALHTSGQSIRRVSYDRLRDNLYIADYGISSVFKFSGMRTFTNGQSLTATTMTVPFQPGGVFINEATDIMYVSDYLGGIVHGYTNASTLSGSIASNFTLTISGGITGAGGMYYEPTNNYLYVTSYGLNGVYAFYSPSTTSTSANLIIPTSSQPVSVAVDPTR